MGILTRCRMRLTNCSRESASNLRKIWLISGVYAGQSCTPSRTRTDNRTFSPPLWGVFDMQAKCALNCRYVLHAHCTLSGQVWTTLDTIGHLRASNMRQIRHPTNDEKSPTDVCRWGPSGGVRGGALGPGDEVAGRRASRCWCGALHKESSLLILRTYSLRGSMGISVREGKPLQERTP